MISIAGGSLPTTYRLCRAVFEEVSQPPEEIPENDPEYREIKDHLEFRSITASHEVICKSYRETLQHAQTAKYLLKKIVLDGEAFSEATFTEAHGILTYKIDINQQARWELYSGKYRTWSAPYNSRFLEAVHIPTAMLSMIDNLAMEMASRDVPYDEVIIHRLSDEEVWERICYATKFCQHLINIHPFSDGNGRMHRMLLTILLLRAGVCPAVYGLYIKDRLKYSQAETRCYMHVNDMQGLGGVIKANEGLASFVRTHTRGGWDSTDVQMGAFLVATRPDGARLPQQR
ncbi:hypothetical protein FGADI_3700 [Fusarium gaditjirri]|uniref:Fido domain-containing protein n=1 Tax=Fusarium gaditjirri TaxID=282569 RepID=A0A8H4TEK6_9HYPO|nr:hypothetical protein FGADI_3700 [Fusarium gaditjirri]